MPDWYRMIIRGDVQRQEMNGISSLVKTVGMLKLDSIEMVS